MDKFFPHLMQSDTTSTHDTDSSISFALRKIWSCKSQHIKVISKGHNMEVKKSGTSPIIDINRIISGRIPAVSWLSNICMPINQNLNLFRMRIRKSSLCWLGKEETPQRAIWKSLNANHFLQRFLYSLSSELLVRYVFNIQTQILEKKKKNNTTIIKSLSLKILFALTSILICKKTTSTWILRIQLTPTKIIHWALMEYTKIVKFYKQLTQ